MVPKVVAAVGAGAASLLLLLLGLAAGGSLDLGLGPLRIRSEALAGSEAAPPREPRLEPAAPARPERERQSEGAPAPRPHGVVLLIGDGLGAGGLSVASAAIHGEGGDLAVESMPVAGLVRTTAAEELVTDSAASATAMATGRRTRRGMVSELPDGSRPRTLFEAARAAGLATGAITTSGLMDATPACFMAHAESRESYVEILLQMLGSGAEVLAGASWDTAEDPAVVRALDGLGRRGVRIVEDAAGLDGVDGPFVALFGPRAAARHAGGPPLEVTTRAGLRVLARDPDGFVLLVECEDTDSAGHHNDVARLVAAVRELDAAVRVVLAFAREHPETLVLVTADHDTGGPGIVGGPAGDPSMGEVRWLSDGHTAIWVPLFASGPGAERFAGVLDNSDIGPRIAELLGLEGLPRRGPARRRVTR